LCKIEFNYVKLYLTKQWYYKLELVKNYININKKRPSGSDKDINIKQLGVWIDNQVKNYKNKAYIMSDDTIRKSWEEFINDDNYKEYFLDNNVIWYNNLEKVKHYINTNNIRPSQHDRDINIKQLGSWIGTQIQNYKKHSYIMLENTIRNTWTTFINDPLYKKYFD
jgi:hypothetical protein